MTLLLACMQGGTDAGDHPPITPVRGASEAEIGGGDSWRLYDYVARHFLGSISPDCIFRRTRASFTCGTETFSASGTMASKPGFTAIMPWRVGEHRGLRHCTSHSDDMLKT